MDTLDEHNKKMDERFPVELKLETKANVTCPGCGTELVYTHPGPTTASFPPLNRVQCPNCPFHGWKR